MNRREFLNHLQSLTMLATLGSLPGLTLFSRPIAAANRNTSKSKFFVLMRISGGWDVTLCLDPKVHENGSTQEDMFIQYRPDDILRTAGLKFAPPCAPLLPFANSLSVINGIYMSDANVSHEANLSYISTGDSEGRAADLPVEIANALGVKPFGVVFNKNLITGNRPIMPTTVDNLKSLTSTIPLEGMREFMNADKAQSPFLTSRKNLLNSAPLFNTFTETINRLANDDVSSLGTEIKDVAKLTAAAFASGLSAQGLFDITADLDTHDNHETRHLAAQNKLWSDVADIFNVFLSVPFGDGSLFDHTTFAVISDFARTPSLNPSLGKDHNPMTNSMLLAGAGVNGGRTMGQSLLVQKHNSVNGESRHVGGPIEYSTNRAPKTKEEANQDAFQFIFPENAAATLVEIMGIDRATYGSLDPKIASLNSLVR